MIFKRLLTLIFVAMFCWIAALCGCTQSDDVIFNESDPQFINVNAFFSKSLDSNTYSIKSDTIHPGDSIVLLTSVYPSKAIRSKDYFWTKDGDFFAFEYNCKKAIYDPGYHQFNFVFIDYFGDTLTDTLHLYVGSAPVLDNENFIPANNTQYIGANEFVNFAWNLYDPDSMWDMSHHFVLKEAKGFYKDPKTLVDTVLHAANFTYRKGFKPLGMYEWTVSVQNELKQRAQDSIKGTFTTAGIQGEAGIYGFINHSSMEKSINVHLWLVNSSGNMVYDDTVSFTKNSPFSIKPLDPDEYTLYTMASDYPDFSIDTTEFKIPANRVMTLDTIFLNDTIPPRIRIADGSDETIAYADTLKFTIKDQGGKIQEKRIKVKLDNQSVSSFSFRNDSLLVTLPELENSWTTHFISISAFDYSVNTIEETFKIAPNKTLPEVYSE